MYLPYYKRLLVKTLRFPGRLMTSYLYGLDICDIYQDSIDKKGCSKLFRADTTKSNVMVKIVNALKYGFSLRSQTKLRIAALKSCLFCEI